ncbi:hypothetical protein CSKR_203018 [Clonorchis sinensis]|uniref:Uncharacterized protein n=1 Tax=Clonorchis sinensis TaxID=79923 RepID=A0A8T1M6R9_CLOSI|nr:hypothetical protein CSKR_203018 [Clonorchis sinensis]
MMEYQLGYSLPASTTPSTLAFTQCLSSCHCASLSHGYLFNSFGATNPVSTPTGTRLLVVPCLRSLGLIPCVSNRILIKAHYQSCLAILFVDFSFDQFVRIHSEYNIRALDHSELM